MAGEKFHQNASRCLATGEGRAILMRHSHSRERWESRASRLSGGKSPTPHLRSASTAYTASTLSHRGPMFDLIPLARPHRRVANGLLPCFDLADHNLLISGLSWFCLLFRAPPLPCRTSCFASLRAGDACNKLWSDFSALFHILKMVTSSRENIVAS